MTTPLAPAANLRRLAGWTTLALLVAGITACGATSSDTVATSPTDTAPTTLAPTTVVSASAVPPSTTPVATGDASTTTAPAAQRPTGVNDQLVVVSGGHLHIHCTGAGPTTVILIAGWNDDRSSFSTVEPALAASTRVCSYDKFGTGTSDPAPAPQGFSAQATDLHAMLEATNEIGPYIVVGHSFGGDVAVTFASKFPDEVRGVLLLDATPTTWNSVLCAVPNDGTPGSTGLAQVCEMQAAAGNNAEAIDGPSAFAEMAGISSLGAMPLIVDTAAERGYVKSGVGPEVAAQLTDAWNAGQSHWVSLSSEAQLVEVPNSGHYIHIDQPRLVLGQIASLLA